MYKIKKALQPLTIHMEPQNGIEPSSYAWQA